MEQGAIRTGWPFFGPRSLAMEPNPPPLVLPRWEPFAKN